MARRKLTPLWLILRTILRFIRDADGFFSYWTTKVFPKQYQVTGGCLKRGVCCTCIGMHLSKDAWESPILKEWINKWYEFVYNFELVREEDDCRVLVYKCNYLKDNKCSIYRRRPYICRNYPMVRYFGKPQVLPGCGYQIQLRQKLRKS